MDASDGRLVKMEVDYASQVDTQIPEAEKLLKANNLTGALDLLGSLEKQSRLGSDMRSNERLLQAMVRLCFDAKNWQVLSDTVVALSKKRSLIKAAVTKMVQLCCTYVEQMPNETERLKLIDTLRTVTAGKIYVEVERARLTKKLVEQKEQAGDTEAACNLLLELQIETYGSMDQKEKVQLLLEQMRLTLLRNDYVRSSIISRKVSTRFFEKTEPEVQELKLLYYKHMITLDAHEAKYKDVCAHYRALAATPCVVEKPEQLDQMMRSVVLYALLTPHCNEQWQLLHLIQKDKNIDRIPQYKKLLETFTTELLINWKTLIGQKYEKLLRHGVKDSPATDVFKLNDTEGEKRWADFETRVGEHNIRIIAKYYSCVKLTHMAALLDWDLEKTEKFLCALVTDGVVGHTKIDRPAGVVYFRAERNTISTMDDWGTQVTHLHDTLNKAVHLIQKEQMVHKHMHAKA